MNLAYPHVLYALLSYKKAPTLETNKNNAANLQFTIH